MYLYVSKRASNVQTGTQEYPFATIQQAAELAQPGDTVLIAEGVYREWVRPARGGTEDARITYKAVDGARAVISGAEAVTGWENCGGGVWKAAIASSVLADYNPYEDKIFGDWYDPMQVQHHTGEIFADDKALYEVDCFDHIAEPSDRNNWFAQAGERETAVWVYLPEGDPNEMRMEATVRPFCFFPEKEGLNYITVSGLTIEKAATQWAPPTAFQPGLIGPNWSRGWIIENCVIRGSKCCGVSLGKRREKTDNQWSYDSSKSGTQTYTEVVFDNIKGGWTKETVGGHVVRNNEIYDCGQTGIVGSMGGVFSTISHNHIYNCNNRGEFGGAEMGGIKLHAAIDVTIEDNVIHDCIHGTWLDWQAQGARVTRNVYFDNIDVDLFLEVNHGPITVDNNLFLSQTRNCGLLHVSQGVAFVHNLFTAPTTMLQEPRRFTPYHYAHETMVHGLIYIYGGDDRVIGNVYLGEKTGNAIYNGYPTPGMKQNTETDGHLANANGNPFPVTIRDNVYLNGAKPFAHEERPVEVAFPEASVRVAREDGHFYLETNLPDELFAPTVLRVGTENLGTAFEPGARYENPDGTPFVLECDVTGAKRAEKTAAGPFAAPVGRILLV